MHQRIWGTVILILCVVGGFATAAYAQTVPEEPIIDLVRPVLEAVMAGNWWVAVAGALVLGTAATVRYAPWAWVRTGLGKLALLFGFTYGGALLAGLAGTPMSVDLAWSAFKLAAGAGFGYSAVTTLLKAVAGWGVAPHWVVRIALFLYDALTSKDIKAAEAAGDAAVAANPPAGATGVVGEPKDVR
jgi:hypothetical protein